MIQTLSCDASLAGRELIRLRAEARDRSRPQRRGDNDKCGGRSAQNHAMGHAWSGPPRHSHYM